MTWVVELYKSADSTKVGSYSYDSWGKLLGATYAAGVNVSSVYDILNKNPFRYRGYYYDQETGWYYLQSRYYDPEVKRFVSSDVTSLIETAPDSPAANKNLYAYCDNNPVVRADSNGHLWNFIIGGAVGALVSGIAAGVSSYMQTGSVNWGDVAISAACGAISGVAGAAGIPLVPSAILSGVIGGAGDFAKQVHNKGLENVDYGQVAISGATGIATAAVSGAIGGAITKGVEKSADTLLKKGAETFAQGQERAAANLMAGFQKMGVGQGYAHLGNQTMNQVYGMQSTFSSMFGAGTEVLYAYYNR